MALVLLSAAAGGIVGWIAADISYASKVEQNVKRTFAQDDAARAQQFNRSEK